MKSEQIWREIKWIENAQSEIEKKTEQNLLIGKSTVEATNEKNRHNLCVFWKCEEITVTKSERFWQKEERKTTKPSEQVIYIVKIIDSKTQIEKKKTYETTEW